MVFFQSTLGCNNVGQHMGSVRLDTQRKGPQVPPTVCSHPVQRVNRVDRWPEDLEWSVLSERCHGRLEAVVMGLHDYPGNSAGNQEGEEWFREQSLEHLRRMDHHRGKDLRLPFWGTGREMKGWVSQTEYAYVKPLSLEMGGHPRGAI